MFIPEKRLNDFSKATQPKNDKKAKKKEWT